MTDTVKLTVAQALARFPAAREVERDGVRAPFFAGCFGILGHGNLAGLGRAFARHGDLLQSDTFAGRVPHPVLQQLEVSHDQTMTVNDRFRVIRAETIDELRAALDDIADAEGPVVICVETDRYDGVPNLDGWWEVPVAEISEDPLVRSARETYEQPRRDQRLFLETP
jgi:TPP-dependent trihydroxycyclohexane-1,2-dione (THcHDO) dehydratase